MPVNGAGAPCCHCTRPITPSRPGMTYAVSRARAHIRCVSFPSAAAIDRILYEQQLYEPAYTGRALGDRSRKATLRVA
jgi:hypothetical protein